MEIWSLHHPEVGLIELEQGFDAEFLEGDPDWPLEEPAAGDGERPRLGVRPGPNASFRERIGQWHRNPPQRLQIKVDGRIRGRFKATTKGVLPLKGEPAALKLADVKTSADREKPHLRIHTNLFGDLLRVEFRDKGAVVEFEPPAGSRGEKRHRAMESSGFKRVAYPLLGGLGKAGWAILLLVLLPLLGRLLPDLDVGLPAFHLPQIHLPVPAWPRIELPVFPEIHLRFPQLNLPPLPAWLVTVLEHDEIWKPVLFGLAVGLISLRNHRRSEAEKARWARARAEAATAETQPNSPNPQESRMHVPTEQNREPPARV